MSTLINVVRNILYGSGQTSKNATRTDGTTAVYLSQCTSITLTTNNNFTPNQPSCGAISQVTLLAAHIRGGSENKLLLTPLFFPFHTFFPPLPHYQPSPCRPSTLD
ncbi:hypothetical protein T265_07966 [Opisthorchis viverrini]|uniref:Uncharacterized protein n=1 Tax=Opisthorchis viverrini TaxID=6198 RepID=A0A075A9V4_OPIVI|nr:hypothetical protein T265_07966 [Opisthorchis viverrini]KER24324.1 hypothetical protein T265_07966 [Opisthorchis viverrini]